MTLTEKLLILCTHVALTDHRHSLFKLAKVDTKSNVVEPCSFQSVSTFSLSQLLHLDCFFFLNAVICCSQTGFSFYQWLYNL
jgi:hypothetical protein